MAGGRPTTAAKSSGAKPPLCDAFAFGKIDDTTLKVSLLAKDTREAGPEQCWTDLLQCWVSSD